MIKFYTKVYSSRFEPILPMVQDGVVLGRVFFAHLKHDATTCSCRALPRSPPMDITKSSTYLVAIVLYPGHPRWSLPKSSPSQRQAANPSASSSYPLPFFITLTPTYNLPLYTVWPSEAWIYGRCRGYRAKRPKALQRKSSATQISALPR